MAFTPGNQLTSAAAGATTTVCAAPGSNTRRIVRTITVYNTHTGTSRFTLNIDAGSTDRRLVTDVLVGGDTYIWNDMIVLDATNELIEIAVEAATAAMEVTVHFADES